MGWIEQAPVATARAALDAVLSVVLAPACAACDELLDRPTNGPVCARCWGSILPLTPPLCDCCGDPLPSWRSISLPLARCPRCRRTTRAVDRARAIGPYDGALRAIVHALKYEGRRSLARPLGGLMRHRGADVLEGAACVVPVPLHPSRRRERGFNQAADLARHLGLPLVAALSRTRATSADGTASRSASPQCARCLRGHPCRRGPWRSDGRSRGRCEHDRGDAGRVRPRAEGGGRS